MVEAGFHQRAIRLVAAGAVDAAAIDSQVLAIELRDHPRLAGLRVIGAFGPSTIQPVVAASRLPGGSRTRSETSWSPWPTTRRPAGARLRTHRPVHPVGDAAYDDIRAMLATIETAGWTSLTQRAVDP